MLASAAVLSSQADVLNFGYCTDEIVGIGYQTTGVEIAGAIKIPAAKAQQFAGNKITTASIGFAQSTPKRVTIFLTYDLAGEPFYTQLANLKVNRFNDVPLTTPYEFEGRDVYIGYKITTTSPSDKPIGIDQLTIAANPDGDWFSSTIDGNDLADNWTHIGDNYGNIALRVFVEGDNLADFQNCLRPIDVYAPAFVQSGQRFNGKFSFQNTGVQPISNVSIEYRMGDNPAVPMDITLDTPIEPAKCTQIELPSILVSAIGENIPFTVRVLKVNGVDNQYENSEISNTFTCSPYMTNRPLVIEEGTGQWCGYCVAGYVALENMREQHTDGSYVGIAVHNTGGRGPDADVMHCDSYQSWVSAYISGFPQATANRKYHFSPQPSTIGTYYNAVTEMPANILVNAKCEFTDDTKNAVKFDVTTRALKDLASHNYGLAVVITEDNVGPYYQENYYAGGALGPMGGFESKPSKARVIYNDVARQIYDWRGNKNHLPASYEANQEYLHSRVISLPSSVANPENIHVIAMVIDTVTEEIENAFSASPAGGESGMKPAVMPDFTLISGKGNLSVYGDDIVTVEVYDLNGRKAASLEGPGTINIPSGIYAVKGISAEGIFTGKAIVR